MEDLAKAFDHTILKATATKADIAKLCDEAIQHGFFGICCEPRYVAHAKKRLAGSAVKVVTVVGFPLGSTYAKVKALEMEIALTEGADEIDWVLDQVAVANDDEEAMRQDIAVLATTAAGRCTKKLILETCYMRPEQISTVTHLAALAGIDFVKTSTGFGTRGASLADVAAMQAGMQGCDFKPAIKASGGIRNLADALGFIKAGCVRLGTSASVAIIEESRRPT